MPNPSSPKSAASVDTELYTAGFCTAELGTPQSSEALKSNPLRRSNLWGVNLGIAGRATELYTAELGMPQSSEALKSNPLRRSNLWGVNLGIAGRATEFYTAELGTPQSSEALKSNPLRRSNLCGAASPSGNRLNPREEGMA